MRYAVGLLLAFSTPALAMSPSEIIGSNQRSVVYLAFKSSSGEVLERATGFLVSHDGLVVTAAHIEPTEEGTLWAIVGAREGTEYPLTRRARDADSDVAVWQFPQASSCRAAVTLSSKKPSVTDHVLSLGFPTSSGLTPNTLSITNLITGSGNWKTDGFLAPGNSGGPVFDQDGTVIALVHGGGVAGTENNEIIPISFAIPLLQRIGAQFGVGTAVPYDASCYSTCRHPSHGIERYETVIPWKADSGWMGSGHNRTDECNIVAGGQKVKFDADAITVKSDPDNPEDSEMDVYRKPSYRYHCVGEALKGPVYFERQSTFCPLWQ